MNINGRILTQVTNSDNGTVIGLYLVPIDKTEEFEQAMENIEDQDEFDCENTLGVERVFVDELILSVKF